MDGVPYVDDSKATNADAAARALGCYDRIVWIAGGIAKAGGIAPLAPVLPAHRPRAADRPRRPALAAELGGVPHELAGTLEQAVPAARARPRRTGADVVLLSPACASLRPVQRVRGARPPLRRTGAGLQREGRLMPALSRADTSTLGRWWWTVDRLTLLAIAVLIGFGYVMMLAASPAVAERIHVSRDSFILKQVVFLLRRPRSWSACRCCRPRACGGWRWRAASPPWR